MISGKNILMVVAPNDFRDEELSIPKETFEKYGATATVASTLSEARGILGMRIKTKTIDEISVDDYDAVIFVGGPGAQIYFNNSKILAMAKESYNKNKITAAICIAPIILANSGILDGKKATVWNGDFRKMLEAKGAIYTGKAVERDGNIITANGPQSAREFAELISKSL